MSRAAPLFGAGGSGGVCLISTVRADSEFGRGFRREMQERPTKSGEDGATTILGLRPVYRRYRDSVLAILQFSILAVGLVWLTVAGADQMGYNWQWYRVPDYIVRVHEGGLLWGPLAYGFVETLKLSAIAFVLTVALGITVAVLRLTRSITGRAVATVYIELIRNTPLLVQLYIVYFVLAPIIGLDRYWTAVLCLTLFEAAFAAEIFRGGIMGVVRGQWEAAASLGLTRLQAYRDIILPQAVRLVLPPLTGLAVSLVKHSSIVSVIAVFELTTEGRNIISDTYMAFEIWLTVAAMYLAITVTLSFVAAWLEQRLAVAT
jgi:polar amino acid transport system permease protein